jgi:hypothetical protein
LSSGTRSASSQRSAPQPQRQQSASANQETRSTGRQAQQQQAQQSRQQQQGQSQQSRAQQQQSRQSAASQNQAQRQQYSNQNVETRQQGSTDRTQSRQATVQNSGAYYSGGYRPPPAGYSAAARADYYDEHTWDDGEVAAVGLGAAAVGAMAGYAAGNSQSSQGTASQAPAPSGSGGLPCTPNTKVVSGVTYYQCGSAWYTQAYGSSGVMYIPVAAP